MSKAKSPKINSRWRKGGNRTPTRDEKVVIDRLQRQRTTAGWHNGARVQK